VPALYDVTWSLRSGETTSWADASSELMAFSVGRWECALGEVQSDDALGPTELDLRRTRRLACTHATGATVQTQLQCTLHVARTTEPQQRTTHGDAQQPQQQQQQHDLSVQQHERELSLQLDATPTLHLRCAPQPVAQLALISRDKRLITSICATPSSLSACSAAETPTLEDAAQPAATARPRP